jgi:geranylgeranyl diphosphate synthase type I
VLDRVGEPDPTDADVAALQQVLVDSGALAEIEALVDELTGRAIDAIEAAEIAPEACDELVELARYVASRDA